MMRKRDCKMSHPRSNSACHGDIIRKFAAQLESDDCRQTGRLIERPHVRAHNERSQMQDDAGGQDGVEIEVQPENAVFMRCAVVIRRHLLSKEILGRTILMEVSLHKLHPSGRGTHPCRSNDDTKRCSCEECL